MRLLFVLRRDLGAHRAISRNLQEGFWMKMLRLFWCMIYLVKAFWLGLKATRREQLGSQVEYQGKRLAICNWAGSDSPTLFGNGFYQQNVPRSEIKSVMNAREVWHRFNFGFEFYMGNWHQSDVHRRLYRGLFK